VKLQTILDGIGQLRRSDGAIVGTRDYHVQIWRGEIEFATSQGPHRVRGARLVNLMIRFRGWEASGFFQAAKPMTLVIEDGREVTFMLENANGDVVYHRGLQSRTGDDATEQE
jgi:hypothetical protein